MSTYPRVSFGLYNLEINADSSLSSVSDLQTFSKIDDLKTGNVTSYPVATYEPNFWLLDGNYKFILENEDAVHVGMMSLSMSDVNGDFADPPVLVVNFTTPHTTDGLVLHFFQYSDDYANSIKVEYFDQNNASILSSNYAPDSWEFEIDQVVENFKKIEITFYSTNNPYRYLRLSGIDYGQLIYFTTTDIKSAHVVEEIDMIGAKIIGNTCDLSIYSDDTEFSIVNPTGYYARLNKRQPLSIYEIVNTKQVFMGRYFLDTWENESETEMKFGCVDSVEILGRIPFKGGLWLYAGVDVQSLVYEVLNNVAKMPYELDPDLYDIMVMGWIPYTNCRDALQQIAFAVGAYVDCSRSGLIKIYKSKIVNEISSSTPVLNSQFGISAPLKLRPLVTGVNIVSHNYSLGIKEVNLFDGDMTIGNFDIKFKEPVHTLSITGASIVTSGANFATVKVVTAGTVVLTGLNYEDSQQNVSINNMTGVTTVPNILSIETATLVNDYNASEVVGRVNNYYQQRYLLSGKIFQPSVEIGSVVLVDSYRSSKIRGAIEKMDIDLTGGFLAQSVIVGVVDQ